MNCIMWVIKKWSDSNKNIEREKSKNTLKTGRARARQVW